MEYLILYCENNEVGVAINLRNFPLRLKGNLFETEREILSVFCYETKRENCFPRFSKCCLSAAITPSNIFLRYECNNFLSPTNTSAITNIAQ